MKQLPKGWEWKNLGDVCDLKKGTSITKQKISPGEIPVIAGGHQPAYYHNLSNRNGNVITVSASGAYAGFINYFENPIFASDCITVQSSDENSLLTKFVFLNLKSIQKRIFGLQTGAGQPHVYSKDLVKIKIPVPPIAAQIQIVSILERAENLKEQRQKANEETNKIIQSIFYEMFGDPVRNEKNFPIKLLNDICDVRDGTHDSPKYTNKGYPLITSKNVTKGFIDFNDARLISKKDFDIVSKRSYVDDGDIIMPMIGTIGKPIIVRKDREFAIKNVALIKFKGSNISNIYIKELLTGEYFAAITQRNNRGGTQKFISLADIRNIPVPVPPKHLQKQFEGCAKALESLRSHQNESTMNISNLFDALMQKAFEGELVNA